MDAKLSTSQQLDYRHFFLGIVLIFCYKNIMIYTIDKDLKG